MNVKIWEPVDIGGNSSAKISEAVGMGSGSSVGTGGGSTVA